MLTETQKQTAQAIVNIFETGSARGEYGQVTLLAGDTGHLTYGRAQTTLASGNLFLLIKAYVETPLAQFGTALAGFLPALEAKDISLDNDSNLHELLKAAGEDPVMWDVQDQFFDRVYWEPTVRSANFISVVTPLGFSVVYDSRIHGSWHRMRDRTIDEHGTVDNLGEKNWIGRYVDTRRDWLANHSNRLLRRTVYRMDSFLALIADNKWDLPLPLEVRGVTIDESVLSPATSVRASAEDVDELPMLKLREPRTRGDAVKKLQELLKKSGANIEADGDFGPATDRAVRAYQEKEGLVADGIVGPSTWSALLD